jgi:Sec-independent protein translocase protein TatA
MRGVGQGMKEFKKATSEDLDDDVVDDTSETKEIKDGKK